MPKLYDRAYGVTEEELIEASKLNSWTVGDVLSAYTGQVKLTRVFEELEDNGDIEAWSIDNHCSEQEMHNSLINFYDDAANLRVYGHLRGVEVRCVVVLQNKMTLYMYMPVKDSKDEFRRFESRVRKLERLLKLS